MKPSATVVLAFVISVIISLVLFGLYNVMRLQPQEKIALDHLKSANRHLPFPLHVDQWPATTKPREEAPYVIVIHALYMDNRLLMDIIRQWPSHTNYNIVYPDLLGHGDSPWPDCEYGVKLFVETLHHTIRRVVPRGSRVHVMGPCFGGIIAMELSVLLHQAKEYDLLSVTMMALPYFSSEKEAQQTAAAYAPTMYGPHGFLLRFFLYYIFFRQRWLFKRFIRFIAQNSYPDFFTNDMFDGMMKCSRRAMDEAVLSAHRHRLQKTVAKLCAWKIPTLVICGVNDSLCGAQQNRLVRDLGDTCEFHWVDGGHMFVNKHLHDTFAHIGKFFRRVEASSGPMANISQFSENNAIAVGGK